MSRVRQKPATKGSQKWLQLLVNRAPHLLDYTLAGPLSLAGTDKIEWLSPRADDGYAEYRGVAALARVGVETRRTPLASFWPAQGPQWDGLGLTSRGEPLFMEARSHIPELLSPPCRATGRSLGVIRASLDRVKRAVGSRAAADWCTDYYQYTNRLAHQYFLRTLNQAPAYLVAVYFLNDTTMGGPRTAEEWAGALRLVHAQLGIDDRRVAGVFGGTVIEAFVDVRDIEAATT